MNDDIKIKIEQALLKSWSEKTSLCFGPDNAPSYGQCAQTAIVIQEEYGGEILKTDGWPKRNGSIVCGRHFYNRINGKRYDFTSGQFTEMKDYTCNIEYKDLLSNAEEAASEALPSQIEALREAFAKAMGIKRKVVVILGLKDAEDSAS